MNFTNRESELYGLGEAHRHLGGRALAQEIIRKGGTAGELMREIHKRAARTDLDTASGVNLGKRDLGSFSLVDLVQAEAARITGNASPAAPANLSQEISNEVQRMSGWVGAGAAVPWGAVMARDFNIGAATEAGNLTGAPIGTSNVVDPLRANLVLARLGVPVVPGYRANFTVPRFSGDQTVGRVSEIGSASESNPNTAQVSFTATRFSSFVEVSRQALLNERINVEMQLRRVLLGAALARAENAFINGDGTGGDPTGFRFVSGIGTVVGGTNGAAPTHDHLVDLEAAPAVANALENAPGFLVNAATRKKLRKTAAGTNLPYVWQGGDTPLLGYRAPVTNLLPSNLTKGTSTTVCSSILYSADWSLSLFAVFGAPDITVDPYSKADAGLVRIHMNVYAACQPLQPAVFAKMDDALAN